MGFRLGPRLNAAGRLEDASLALELLGAADRDAALPLALRLNELNRERQTIEAAMLEAAVAMVPDPPPAALVLSSPDWHEGVVGIVASRVAERFHRPAILLSEGDEEAKGSGRSIAGLRPARRRRADGRAPARHSAGIAPPAACVCGATPSRRSARPSSPRPRPRSARTT